MTGALLAPGTTTPSVRRAPLPPACHWLRLRGACLRPPRAVREGRKRSLRAPAALRLLPLLLLLPSNGRCRRHAGVAAGAQLAAERLRRLPLAARARRAGHRRQHLLQRALPQGEASLDAAVSAVHISTKWRSTGKRTVAISYLL